MKIHLYQLQKLYNCLNIRGVWVNTNYKQGKSLPQSLYNIVQKEDQTEWTNKEINILEKKFGTNIKLRSIKYYKIHGTLKK